MLHDPDEDVHEESPMEKAKLIYAALNDRSTLPDNPKMLKEAHDSPEWSEWEKAVKAEMDQLHQMGTWELVDLPKGRVPVSNKWVLVQKYNKEGILEKYKACLVAKGYSQIPGMDYMDTFSPVVRLETIRAILALAVSQNWEIQQMDVKGAYLNGMLKEEVYMRQPEGFEDETKHICCLIKTLYGLKQSRREWNIKLNGKLVTASFKCLWSDPCIYIWQTMTNDIEIITVWVNNLLLFTLTQNLMMSLKAQLQSMFEVTDLGDPKKIVGIEITQDCPNRTLFIGQQWYITSILQAQGLEGTNSVKTPADPKVQMFPNQEREQTCHQTEYASLIGSLMYATVATWPDIAYAVNRLALFTANPDLRHWTAAKQVL